MSKFHYGDKVIIIKGIHVDKLGEIRSELYAFPDIWNHQYLVYVDYGGFGKWDLDWIHEKYLEPLEQEELPHPEYLKW